ncbi:zinc-dependent alcohol dehydrogenase [Sphaerimonospora thailandensis]|uniref:Threonine dehydrogenase n=1 Tax=Sphaerimonospora thailandensis TaxID=795644 RepID=A0A8J3R421_9ACTN|nr:zinc-binding dehydrogenase [Sphaerimonospora thailandensis]GIH68048.1 threonine dehydrogenase [Sphaerimonospora thailandensis]
MRTVMVTGPGQTAMVEEPEPSCGPKDIVVKVKACGICGSDALYISTGGLPSRQGAMPLGHEAAGEVIDVGDEVRGLRVGDRVVINPMSDPRGVIGNGGPTGALTDALLVQDAEVGRSVAIIPDDLPFDVAALNEPMAVAHHGVNRTSPKAGDRVVVFGAGPIGLGAAIAYKTKGVEHVIVVDVIESRLEKALAVGADAVINSAEEDVVARIRGLHGTGADAVGAPRAGTDIYLDAAGVPEVINAVMSSAKHNATVGIVAVHKKPVPIDFRKILSTELTLVMAMGYPTEIFEVTESIIANRDLYARIISDRFRFDDALEALKVASTPGAADKVIITFD